jgi:hypothetical protein
MTLPVHQSTETPKVCKMLRTKRAFGLYEDDDHAPWETGESTTAVYWCLGTMQTAGPDDMLVHPHDCREGRGCYQSREG